MKFYKLVEIWNKILIQFWKLMVNTAAKNVSVQNATFKDIIICAKSSWRCTIRFLTADDILRKHAWSFCWTRSTRFSLALDCFHAAFVFSQCFSRGILLFSTTFSSTFWALSVATQSFHRVHYAVVIETSIMLFFIILIFSDSC